MASEILGQKRPQAYLWRRRKDGTEYEIDLLRASQYAASRLGDCGTFPRDRITLTWKDGTKQDLGAHQCNHRLCPRCARRRGHRLAADMAGALKMIEAWGWRNDRTRFATLTIENVEDADEGLTRIMDAWHRTLATKTWGRLIAGGFRAVEVKPGKDTRWNVHLHAILFLWTPGVPYALLRDAWDKAAKGKFNQRFDTLKNKAKPQPGESKTVAAARYLVKYLVKHEELKGTRRMPGGLAHMIGALEGRRLFGAWGLGAAALRIERHERPSWTAAWDRNLTGYQHEGQPPELAELVTPWGTREEIPIPAPPLPAAFRRDEVPDQAEPKGTKWTVRKIHTPNPLELHPWRKLPTANRRTAEGMASALETWINNPKSRGPRPFRWRPWIADAQKEWTAEAGVILGERITTPHLGAALWSRVQPPEMSYPAADHPEHIGQQLIASHAAAIRTARQHMHNTCTPHERIAYLARLPERIRQHLEEQCREMEESLWTYR